MKPLSAILRIIIPAIVVLTFNVRIHAQTTSMDFYSSHDIVSTEGETFICQLDTSRFVNEIIWFKAKLRNVENTLYDCRICDRRTGQPIHEEFYPEMLLDEVPFDSIIRKVFPTGSYYIADKLAPHTEPSAILFIIAYADPVSRKVLEVRFVLSYQDDSSILSIPPSKLEQLEKEIKEKVTVRFLLPEEVYKDEIKNANYLPASRSVYFTGPVE